MFGKQIKLFGLECSNVPLANEKQQISIRIYKTIMFLRNLMGLQDNTDDYQSSQLLVIFIWCDNDELVPPLLVMECVHLSQGRVTTARTMIPNAYKWN